MPPFQPASSDPWPIPPHAARLLGLTFGLTVDDVRRDALDVATSHAPNDEYLLISIESNRGLHAALAAVYLRSLRAALAAEKYDTR